MGRYVTYIHDPNTMLTFDLKVKYIGFLTCLCIQPTTSVCFDIGPSYLTHRSLSPWDNVLHTFMILTPHWPWPEGQICWVFDMALCKGHSFFLLWHSQTIFGTWVYHHELCVTYIHDLCITLTFGIKYQNYFFTMNLCLGKTVFVLWHGHSKFDT